MGVDRLGAAGATLKARVTTEPQAQWRVGREYNRRLKAAFDAAGIGMALQSLAARPPQPEEPESPPDEPRSFTTQERRPPS
jgi:small-conductance mechanosensitive channel